MLMLNSNEILLFVLLTEFQKWIIINRNKDAFKFSTTFNPFYDASAFLRKYLGPSVMYDNDISLIFQIKFWDRHFQLFVNVELHIKYLKQ